MAEIASEFAEKQVNAKGRRKEGGGRESGGRTISRICTRHLMDRFTVGHFVQMGSVYTRGLLLYVRSERTIDSCEYSRI